MPRRRKDSKLQRREKNKERKRQARRKVKDDRKRAENGLNFPKKAENGLNFPKKSEIAEDDMPVTAKHFNDSVAKHFTDSIAKHCTDSDAKHFADSVTETYTESSLNFAKCFPNECLNVCSDFDETFADAYPSDVANRNCRTYKDLSLNEEVIIQNTDIEIIGTGPEIEVTSYNSPCTESLFKNMDTDKPLLTQPSPLLWNANQIMFGSFHQNDKRFLDQSRGFQCTCNALCMLVCDEIQSSLELDKILYAGDVLYNTTVNSLKAQGKFVNSLLSLEEIPDTLEFESVHFFVEKQPITCGALVSTFGNHALPTLHCALETAFIKSTSVLLISGSVCSAVSKRNYSYIFFDSHSHGENGLSSSDGTSTLMSFSCLEDLIAYLYAFYESMRIDMTMQFDLLPISTRKNEHSGTHEKQPENLLEAYFHDQTLRQQQKAVITSNSEPILNIKKKKNRKEYYRIYKQNARHNSTFKAKVVAERKHMHRARQDRDYKAKELVAQRKHMHRARQDRDYKAKELVAQLKSKQKARQDRDYKAKELVAQRKSKQKARQDRDYKAKELVAQQIHMHRARQDRDYKAKELVAQLKSKQKARQDRDYKAKELVAQRKSKQKARQDRDYKAKESVAERKHMHTARQDRDYKAKELVAQRKSKQKARQDRDFKAKESVAQRKHMHKARQDRDYKAKELVAQRKSKQKARQDRDFKAKELVAQRKSKQNARKNPFVLECERVKKQEYRRKKRKIDEVNEYIDLEETHKRRKNNFDDHRLEKTSDQSYFKDIKECIKQFHSSIAVGPLFVCTCCHQTWFRKGVCMLKNINLPTSSRLYCTKFTSVNDEEWICHTCVGAIRDGKVPKLSVANGMKWPDKPPELDLHELEERLISLRIPFMQIRELPRGGQYSLKGNVINVPVDIQPTVSCLPRPMDENFTIAIQLKKKLSHKKVDFKENVRPLKVLTALHWLVNKSELYKRSGVEIDVNWFNEVTESSEETVREFLEVSKEQNKEKHKQNPTREEDMNISSLSKDSTATDDYESDHFSEIDTNEQVGNVDTLVDDENLENKYDKVITFAPGEGQHPLSLYHDVDAEYLCFPTIFCGQRRPSKERTVQVHYSDIVKWELRSVDRRAAQSVPNIFFKHKKLQMKQISDKVNLAVRRCKGKEKKITAAEARNSEYLDKLVKLDEGYYIFRQLRNSPAYLQSRKKDIFAMIRQLSLPTWFMSLSAADTRWTDLLKMLAKLNNGVDYTDKDTCFLCHGVMNKKTCLVLLKHTELITIP